MTKGKSGIENRCSPRPSRSPVRSRHGHKGYTLLEQARTALVPEECRERARALGRAGPSTQSAANRCCGDHLPGSAMAQF